MFSVFITVRLPLRYKTLVSLCPEIGICLAWLICPVLEFNARMCIREHYHSNGTNCLLCSGTSHKEVIQNAYIFQTPCLSSLLHIHISTTQPTSWQSDYWWYLCVMPWIDAVFWGNLKAWWGSSLQIGCNKYALHTVLFSSE